MIQWIPGSGALGKPALVYTGGWNKQGVCFKVHLIWSSSFTGLELSAGAIGLLLALISTGERCTEKELRGFASLELMLFNGKYTLRCIFSYRASAVNVNSLFGILKSHEKSELGEISSSTSTLVIARGWVTRLLSRVNSKCCIKFLLFVHSYCKLTSEDLGLV